MYKVKTGRKKNVLVSTVGSSHCGCSKGDSKDISMRDSYVKSQ